MTNSPPSLTLASEGATTALAQAFARHMQPGDVLLLSGGLAAGKTFFVRAAVAALGSPDLVSSPTYTLANIYQSPKGPVVHMDAYRLDSLADFDDLALEDELEQGFGFIEWGEKLAAAFPDHVALTLEPKTKGTRLASLAAEGPRSIALLAAVQAEAAP